MLLVLRALPRVRVAGRVSLLTATKRADAVEVAMLLLHHVTGSDYREMILAVEALSRNDAVCENTAQVLVLTAISRRIADEFEATREEREGDARRGHA